MKPELGFRIWDLGFGIQELGFRSWDLGVGIWDLRFEENTNPKSKILIPNS
jgi:hypothetical protein